MAMNKWAGIGRLTADPELRRTSSGTEVCNINVAVNRAYVSGGERKADFIPVIVWRKSAEFVSKYFKKGDPIQIIGRLETRKYDDRDGTARFVMEVIAEEVSFVEGAAKKASQDNKQDDEEFEPLDFDEDDMDLPFN
jgi:single-strand DNA-binding protein